MFCMGMIQNLNGAEKCNDRRPPPMEQRLRALFHRPLLGRRGVCRWCVCKFITSPLPPSKGELRIVGPSLAGGEIDDGVCLGEIPPIPTISRIPVQTGNCLSERAWAGLRYNAEQQPPPMQQRLCALFHRPLLGRRGVCRWGVCKFITSPLPPSKGELRIVGPSLAGGGLPVVWCLW